MYAHFNVVKVIKWMPNMAHIRLSGELLKFEIFVAKSVKCLLVYETSPQRQPFLFLKLCGAVEYSNISVSHLRYESARILTLTRTCVGLYP